MQGQLDLGMCGQDHRFFNFSTDLMNQKTEHWRSGRLYFMRCCIQNSPKTLLARGGDLSLNPKEPVAISVFLIVAVSIVDDEMRRMRGFPKLEVPFLGPP